jgi:hypothetical protein
MASLENARQAATMAAYTEPGLRAGWEPDTPVQDTLLRGYLLNLAESNAVPVTALGGRVLRRDDVIATDLGRPTGLLLNTATLLQPLTSERTGQVLDALDTLYGPGGTGAVTLFSAWPTPDLRERGWQLEGHPPLLLRPPSGPVEATAPAGLRIVEVDRPDRLEDWCRVAVDGFPFPELQPYRPGSWLDERVLADGRLRLWVGYDDSGPVCIGALFIEYGLGHMWLAVTLPGARGRGYYRAMANHRIAAAGDLPLVGLFSDMSRPVAERHLGFVPLFRFTVWTRQPQHKTTRAERVKPSGIHPVLLS